jgi:hypothetical protein
MRGRFVLGLGVVFLAGVAWAGEPWKDKPYTAWSDSDVRKILDDSPWAKTISIAATWLRMGAQGPEVGAKISIPRPPRDPDRMEDPDLKNPPPVHDRLYNQFARFLLRWESSRTIRTALRLNALRRGSSSSQSATGSAGAPQMAADLPEYELLLIGDPLAPFPIATESELKANTVLKSKGSGRTLSPTRVALLRRDDGQILEARFYFRKTMAAGQPTIAAGEKAIEFQCHVGGVYLRASFEPARMINAEGLDLR